jgi:hypothetical protein
MDNGARRVETPKPFDRRSRVHPTAATPISQRALPVDPGRADGQFHLDLGGPAGVATRPPHRG